MYLPILYYVLLMNRFISNLSGVSTTKPAMGAFVSLLKEIDFEYLLEYSVFPTKGQLMNGKLALHLHQKFIFEIRGSLHAILQALDNFENFLCDYFWGNAVLELETKAMKTFE